MAIDTKTNKALKLNSIEIKIIGLVMIKLSKILVIPNS